jgi:retron-type reverse transcriptase
MGEWPKDFTEVTMIALKKKPQPMKRSYYRTISLIAHRAKILRRIEKKIEDLFGEDTFGFRTGKLTRDAIAMVRIISKRTLEMDVEVSLIHRVA